MSAINVSRRSVVGAGLLSAAAPVASARTQDTGMEAEGAPSSDAASRAMPAKLADFPIRFIETANQYVGMSRENNATEIADMLGLFGLPLTWGERNYITPFCAAGLSYCAALTYARAAPPVSQPQPDMLRDALIAVNFFHFYPSVSVADMWLVAQGTHRWVPCGACAPQPGWIVAYCWDDSRPAGRPCHAGLVTEFDAVASVVRAIEFNTSPEGTSNSEQQGNGGCIVRRSRPVNRELMGYIDTSAVSPIEGAAFPAPSNL